MDAKKLTIVQDTKKQKKAVRLTDIAEAAGCSVATASYVINHAEGNIKCSEKLTQKILSIAVALNYNPSHRTKSMSK